jgi:hypothetical protein
MISWLIMLALSPHYTARFPKHYTNPVIVTDAVNRLPGVLYAIKQADQESMRKIHAQTHGTKQNELVPAAGKQCEKSYTGGSMNKDP